MIPMTATALEELKVFSAEALKVLLPEKIPSHIAIIMDGNRRWAKKEGHAPFMGHWEGAEVLTDILRGASEIGVKTLTVYAFSTENWNRSETEVSTLMHLFELFLQSKRQVMIDEGVRLHAIGDLSKMPQGVQEIFEETRKATERGSRINLVLALNYGSRDEIRRAVGAILRRHDEKKILDAELTESFIAQFLDTTPYGDPDLLIRTSGELRVSNFLLWQLAYAEIYVTDVLWPDFTPRELLAAVLSYQRRHRRLGD